jgi:hypothetical protein
MKILNSKYDGKCKACGTFISEGDRVRWSKVDGVSWTTCLACPHEPKAKTTPANGTPAGDPAAMIAQLVQQRDAQAADATALRTRIGELTRDRSDLRAIVADYERLVADLRTQVEGLIAQKEHDHAALRAEIAALKADRRMGPLAQLPPEALAAAEEHEPWLGDPAAPVVEDDCPI